MDARELKAYNRGLAVGMAMGKHSVTEIANYLGVTRQTVHKWIRNHNEGHLLAGKHTGRPMKTSERSNRLPVRLAINHNFSSGRQLLQMWRNNASVRTLYRRLRKHGVRKYRAAVRPALTGEQMAAGREWAMRRCAWRMAIWNKVVFSDESRFCRLNHDGRVMVWRYRGQRFYPRNILHTVQGNGGSVHIWGAIWKGGKSDLVILNRNVNGRRYIEIIDRFFNQGNVPLNYIFQDDNAPAHRSNLVQRYHQERRTRRLPWPSRSPDLNPIEHVWDYIGRKLGENEPARNLDDLSASIHTEWNRIPQDFIDSLIDSMPRRVRAVVEADGGNTRY